MVRMLVGLVLAALATGCARSDDPGAPRERGAFVVYATNYPLAYFAERLGGAGVDVRFPVPPGEDPAFWRPDDATLRSMQSADLIVINGASYERWMTTVTLPASRIVDTSESLRDRFIEVKEATTHRHGPGGEHAHTGTAFTTWLDLEQAQVQASVIADALAARLPAQAKQIAERLDELRTDLSRLDEQMTTIAAALRERPLVASHPVYQYWARRYGLDVRSVLWEPEIVPDEAALRDLARLRAEHPAAWMVWEGEPAAASVRALESMGVRSAVFDPCGRRPEEGDFMGVMALNVAGMRALVP